jgi:hypothetical protein
MTEATLGRLVAPASTIERAMAMATLRPSPEAAPYYDEILVEIAPDGVATPAGSTGSSLATYCTADAALFDALSTVDDETLTAIFDIEEFVGWLRWVDDGSPLEVEFVGDPEANIVGAFRLSNGAQTAVVDCYRDPLLLEELTFELPSRFDADERFVLENGDPAPTVVETTAAAMERLADAVDRSPTVDRYPLVVDDGELRVEVERSGTTRVTGRLPGTVEGPDVHNEYEAGFSAVFRTLSGEIELQTGPDEPLVVVDGGEDYALRYVVMPVVW